MGAKYLNDNLVVSYSPFLNAKKINNKWYMRLRKSRVYRDWSKSIAGWAGAERGVGHEVLSLVQGLGRAIFSYPYGVGHPILLP